MKKSLLLMTPLYLVALPVLAAPLPTPPMCTSQTTAGYWGYTCEGQIGDVPVRLLGTCTSSKAAFWDCAGTFNFGGYASLGTLQGNAENLANCTGTIDYAINGNPEDLLHISYVIFDHGDTIQGLPTNPGFVVGCSLKRISRPAD